MQNRLMWLGVLVGCGWFFGSACSKQEPAKPTAPTASAPKAESKDPVGPEAVKAAEAKQAPFRSEAPPKPVAPPGGRAQPTPTTPAEPPKPPAKVSFKEKEFNFGNVIEGDEAKHVFEFTSEGPGDLILTNVQPSCGCTTKKITLVGGDAEKDYTLGTAIPAGMVGRIEAILNTTNIHGPKTSRISVISNDPQSPTTMLQISATVEQFFKLEPPHVYQGNIVGKSGGETLVKVSCLKAPSFEIQGWDPLPEGLDLQVTKPDPEKPNYAEVKVLFKPGMKEGIFNHQLVLKTRVPDVEKPRDIRLVVTGTILGPILFNPPHVGFGLVTRGKAQTAKLTVQNRDPKLPLKVTEVQLDSPQKEFLAAAIKEDLAGQTFSIELTVNEKAPPGVFKGTLTVKMDHPEKPEHKISFSGVVR